MLLVGQLDSPFVRRVAVSITLLGRPFERDRSSVSPGIRKFEGLMDEDLNRMSREQLIDEVKRLRAGIRQHR